MAAHRHYRSEPPQAQGLYDPRNEHDACGVGFIVNVRGQKSHQLLLDAQQILVNLQHRGACGCEDNTGDGAGLMLQVPHKFLTKACTEIGIKLPGEPGEYGVGIVFLPSDPAQRKFCEEAFERTIAEEGQRFLGWRDVPRDNSQLGATALRVEPTIRQALIGRGANTPGAEALEWKLYVIRKRMESYIAQSSLSQKRF